EMITKKSLPSAEPKGYSLELIDHGNAQLWVDVKSNTAELEGLPLTLITHFRGKLVKNERKMITNQSARFTLSTDQLGEGVNHLTLFDANGNPVAERLFFNPPKSDHEIEIQANQKEYLPRTQIELDLKIPEKQPVNMSMAVYRVDDFQTSEKINIQNYLLLSSDLKGRVESPWYYFAKDSMVKTAADNLMLTHGWRRFDWKELMNETTKMSLFPEYMAPIIEGEIIDRETKLPVSNVVAYLFLPGKNFVFRAAQSNVKGKVYFEINGLRKNVELIARLKPEDESRYQLRLIDPYSQSFGFVENSPLELTLSHKFLLEDRSVNMQTQRLYHRTVPGKTKTDSLPFYGKPDEEYYLDDYVRFPIMEEVMREYIRGVLVRRDEGKFQYRIFDLNTDKLFPEGPLVLLDGVPVFDIDKIMALDPLTIKRIQVKRRKEFQG
ncbi:MAG: hypothetical protein KDD63_26040, partial [Bacteroidetes bacterium]|nr:hypothetical protein [Bacteroidota bacterium]